MADQVQVCTFQKSFMRGASNSKAQQGSILRCRNTLEKKKGSKKNKKSFKKKVGLKEWYGTVEEMEFS